MKRQYKEITEVGNYTFGNNYNLILRYCEWYYLDNCNINCGNYCVIKCGDYCNITCEDNCKIICGSDCKIKCGNNCIIDCGWHCIVTCGNNCKAIFREGCYIKAGEGSQLKLYGKLKKTFTKCDEFIWWCYYYNNDDLINTYEDKTWKEKNLDKWNEFYVFVHNELDSATLF